ncbi:MAG TPA: hypothetical protein VKQ71_01035 [Acidimicrobiales bacterium]|nr:hypothetical protein [Acidimicrobiales bacterium]
MGAKLVTRAGAATLIMVLASCTSASPHANGVPPGAHVVGGGCGSTTLYRDASQPWASTAQGPSHLVQATGHGDQVTAFLFGYPLRAGDPQDRSNKILWVVRTPRDGSELVIVAHPLGSASPSVEQHESANSSPGEIYPSIVNVPKAACWQFTLIWHGNSDTMDLPYGS